MPVAFLTELFFRYLNALLWLQACLKPNISAAGLKQHLKRMNSL